MSRLGDFLEAVYGPTERFKTIQASIRHWRNRQLADAVETRKGTVIGRRKAPPDAASRPEEAILSVWIALPDCMRVERERHNRGQVEASLTVVNGAEWWDRDHEGHVETPGVGRRSRPSVSDVKHHFDRANLREIFVALTLEGTGTVRTAGCDCVQVRAVPRPGGRLWPHWLPYGADEYEFHAEPERGVLLSIIARSAGEVFERCEVTQVAFDEPLDSSLFSYTPAAGEQVRPADPITEHLTLEAALVRMPFAVLVPARVPDPDQSQLEVMYHPPRLRSPRGYLCLTYGGSAAYENLWMNECGTADPDELNGYEWERVEREGKPMCISDPGAEGMRVVLVEQGGTHVTIWSDLDRERLLDLAASLVPARAAPKR